MSEQKDDQPDFQGAIKGLKLYLVFGLLIYGIFTLNWIVCLLGIIWLYLDRKDCLVEEDDS